MTNTFFISDTHFNHGNILNFKDRNGDPLRTFSSAEEMNQAMIDNWNSTVKPGDLIYHLGDFSMNRVGLKILEKLNGRKKLLRGNHDIWKVHDYLPYFEDIASVKVMPEHRLIFSHYPLHPSCLYGGKINVHGHTHSNNVLIIDSDEEDSRYINLSVEKTNFKPISFKELLVIVEERRTS